MAISLALPNQCTLPPSPDSLVKSQNDPAIPIDAKLHAAFTDESAEIILCSADKVLFRVHSLVLQQASGWFAALLSLPQSPPAYKPGPTPPSPEIIHMTEPSRVIAALLSMSSGKPLPPLDTLEFIKELIHAAEKYDMPGALSILRLAISTPPFLDAYPIQVYGIACQWDWRDVAKAASAKTVGIDLFSLDAVHELGSIETPHLTRLVLLHRKRREALKAGLDSPEEFYANQLPARCSNCNREVAHVAWLQLKYAWTTAMEQCPADIATGRILQRAELHELLSSVCTWCQRKLYNTEGTITKLRNILDGLPTSVEVGSI